MSLGSFTRFHAAASVRRVASMQRERVAPPINVLPAAKFGQKFRRIRLANQGEIIEPQFLEAAAKSSVVHHLARYQEASRAWDEAGVFDIALLGVVCAG